MQDPKVARTGDGSFSIYNKELDEYYHSRNGALTESKHVFIDAGVSFLNRNRLCILEFGFGTGLNCLLTLKADSDTAIDYDAVELFPLSRDIVSQFADQMDFSDDREVFLALHDAPWEESVSINDRFCLCKFQDDFVRFSVKTAFYDLIYFDAFAPEKQPELWSLDVMKKMYSGLRPGGVLVTYAAAGFVKRNLREAGFKVKRLPGPPGKWHMLRAQKVEEE